MVPVWTSPMQGMTLTEIADACGGKLYGGHENSEVSMITIDSRQVEKDSLYVAIKGARVDGNSFVKSSYEAGALCCMSENEPSADIDSPYIVVKDCYQALKDMAKLYRGKIGAKVVGITGSVGKTTTKEMIASVVSEKFHTLKTQGNFNNEVGVPLTLFRIRKEHQVAIVEMGISDFGEMTRLTDIAKPDMCVITNIGTCHLENLGDRDGVLKAKTEIFKSMSSEGNAYLNGEDDKLRTVSFEEGKVRGSYGEGAVADFVNENKNDNRKIVFFGGEGSDIYAKNIEKLGLKGTKCTVVCRGKEIEVTIPVPGRHMVLNALAAVALADDLGMTDEEIAKGIAKFKPVGGHSSIVETEKFTILNDCYNANPVSMKAGMDVLMEGLGRKIAIIGDMFELGADEKKLHYEVGEYAVNLGIDMLICIGELSKNAYEGARNNEKAADTEIVYFENIEEAMSEYGKYLKKGDTILVKASHGMHFEKIVADIENM